MRSDPNLDTTKIERAATIDTRVTSWHILEKGKASRNMGIRNRQQRVKTSSASKHDTYKDFRGQGVWHGVIFRTPGSLSICWPASRRIGWMAPFDPVYEDTWTGNPAASEAHSLL